MQLREFHNSKEIHGRITPAATSNSFPKDNEKSQPQPQKKEKSSIIDSGDQNRTLMHEIDCFRSSELLVCLLCLNEFSSHDISLHTKLDIKAFPVALFLTNWLLGTRQQNLKFKAITLHDFKMDLIKW